MNISRRFCCHAENAFRPSVALLHAFAAPNGLHRLTRTSIATDLVAFNHRPRKLSVLAKENGVGLSGESEEEVVSVAARPPAASEANKLLEQHVSGQAVGSQVVVRSHGHRKVVDETKMSPEAISRRGEESGLNLRVRWTFPGKRPRPLTEMNGNTSETVTKMKSGSTTNGVREGHDGELKFNLDRFSSPTISKIANTKFLRRNEETLDYDGMYLRPKWKAPNPRTMPWQSDGGTFTSNGSSNAQQRRIRIGAEMEAFSRWIKPTTIEIEAREAVIAETISALKAILPDHKVEAFGSARNGFALASSDIDLRLYTESATTDGPEAQKQAPKWEIRRKHVKALLHARQHFAQDARYKMCILRHARYPLLHYVHNESGIVVQIVCSNDTSQQRDRIRRYLEATPELFDIYAVLKTLLDVRGLTDVFKGGIGSYSLIMMAYAALKTIGQSDPSLGLESLSSRDQNLDIDVKHELLGVKFERVLQFYGVELDTYKYALASEYSGPPRPKIDPAKAAETPTCLEDNEVIFIRDETRPYLLCLQDPDDLFNDLGRQAHRWKDVQATLATLLEGLLFDADPHRCFSYLHRLVGAAIPAYRGLRTSVESYGAKLKESQGVRSGTPTLSQMIVPPGHERLP